MILLACKSKQQYCIQSGGPLIQILKWAIGPKLHKLVPTSLSNGLCPHFCETRLSPVGRPTGTPPGHSRSGRGWGNKIDLFVLSDVIVKVKVTRRSTFGESRVGELRWGGVGTGTRGGGRGAVVETKAIDKTSYASQRLPPPPPLPPPLRSIAEDRK